MVLGVPWHESLLIRPCPCLHTYPPPPGSLSRTPTRTLCVTTLPRSLTSAPNSPPYNNNPNPVNPLCVALPQYRPRSQHLSLAPTRTRTLCEKPTPIPTSVPNSHPTTTPLSLTPTVTPLLALSTVRTIPLTRVPCRVPVPNPICSALPRPHDMSPPHPNPDPVTRGTVEVEGCG